MKGSTRGLTNAPGVVTDTYAYSAFGETLDHSGATVNNYQYTGQQFDSQTGLYSLRARYYDPAGGRFLSQDTYPVNYNNPVELNRYGYTANNPVSRSDPSGRNFVEFSLNLAMSVSRGALWGYVGGFAFSGLLYLMGRAGWCGEKMQEEMCQVDALDYMSTGGTIGAFFGIGIGFAGGFGAAAAAYATMTVGGVGIVASGADIIMNGWNVCNTVGLVLSIATFSYGLTNAIYLRPTVPPAQRPPVVNEEPSTTPPTTGGGESVPPEGPIGNPPTESIPNGSIGQSKVYVDIGAGNGKLSIKFKIEHPNARVIATEKGIEFQLLTRLLKGLGIELIEGTENLAPGIADEAWAVAPNPQNRSGVGIYRTMDQLLRITKPGGKINLVLRQKEVNSTEILFIKNYFEQLTGAPIVPQSVTFGELGIPPGSNDYTLGELAWFISFMRP